MSSGARSLTGGERSKQLPVNNRLSVWRSPRQSRKFVWLLDVLLVLIFALATNQSLWSGPIDRYNRDFETGTLPYDYLILNMNWPVTVMKVKMEERKLVNKTKFWDHITEFGYHFAIHGLWAGVYGESSMGNLRVK